IDFTDPNSPLAPYYLRAGQVVVIGLFVLLYLYYNILPLWHTDVWEPLGVGRWIAQHGRLPEQDPLTPFSSSNRPSTPEWLIQLSYHGLYTVGETLAGGDMVRRLEGGVEFLRTAHVLLGVLLFLVLF